MDSPEEKRLPSDQALDLLMSTSSDSPSNGVSRILDFSPHGRRTDGGDGELRTSVYPSNLAPIGAKLRQRAFQTICKFRFFDADFLFSEKNSDLFFGFHHFPLIFEELGFF